MRQAPSGSCDAATVAESPATSTCTRNKIGTATQQKPTLLLGGGRRYFEDKCCVAWRRTRVLVVEHVRLRVLRPVRWQRGAVRFKRHSSSAREAGVKHDSVRCKHKCGGGRRKIRAKFCTPSGGRTGVGLGRGCIRRHLQQRAGGEKLAMLQGISVFTTSVIDTILDCVAIATGRSRSCKTDWT
jgi:hypothetical protein